MKNQDFFDALLYLCAFSFMRVKVHAPFALCKSVAEKVVSNAK